MPYQYPGYFDRPFFCDRDVTVRDDLGNARLLDVQGRTCGR